MVLDYCINGGIQAMLDEYAHVLYESLGLTGGESAHACQSIADEISAALTLRSAALGLDELRAHAEGGVVPPIRHTMRARFC